MLTKIMVVEARMFFREPAVWLLTILLPTFVLVVVGLLFGGDPDRALGGRRWIDIFAPSMVVMTLAILGVNLLPARLVKYREKGVLRSLSTTPANPWSLLTAQLRRPRPGAEEPPRPRRRTGAGARAGPARHGACGWRSSPRCGSGTPSRRYAPCHGQPRLGPKLDEELQRQMRPMAGSSNRSSSSRTPT